MKAFSFLFLFLFLLCLGGCSESNILLIKRGYFKENKHATIGTLLDSFIDRPKWDIRKTDDGKILVIFVGRVSPQLHKLLYHQLIAQISEQSMGESQSMGCQKAFRIATKLLEYEHISFKEEALSVLTDECLRLCTQRYAAKTLEEQRHDIIRKILNFAYEKAERKFVPVGNRVFLEWEVSQDKSSFTLKNFWLDTFKGSVGDFVESLHEM